MNTQEILDTIFRDIEPRADMVHEGREIVCSATGPKLFHVGSVEDVHFSSHAEQMLLSRIKVPAEYIHRCPNSLYFANVSYWLGNAQNKKFLLRYSNYQAGQVRAVFGSRFSPELDDHKVIPIFLDALKGQNCDLPPRALRQDQHLTLLTIIFPDISATYDGRTLTAGIMLVNSEVGVSALHIRPVVLSKISQSYHSYYSSQLPGRTTFRHNQDLNVGKITQAVEYATRIGQRGIHRLFETTQEMVENPLEELRKLVDDSSVLANNIIDALQTEYEALERTSKFKIAQDIMFSCQQLPVFKQHQATIVVGYYLNLFSGDKERIDDILDDL